MTSMTEVSLQELCSALTGAEWGSGPVHFIGDVGGTNARLGFGKASADGGVVILYTRFPMARKDINELHDFFAVILRSVSPSVISRITSGAVSVPGPVMNGTVGGPFNNLKGVARLADYPVQLFPRHRSALLNDLEAGGFGVLAVSDAHVFKEYFEVMWEGTQWRQVERVPAGTSLGKGRCLVVAPGTGIGTSLIHYNGPTRSYDVVPLELSSTTVAARPGCDAYLQELAHHWGQPQYVPSLEKTANGKAMEFHYLRRTQRQLSAKQIADLAKQGDRDALAAMSQTMENLFRGCSEATMAFLPLTCVLIGDNMVYNEFFFADEGRLRTLHDTVNQHPMQQYGFIGRTTFLRQVKPVNLNLLGCYGFGTHITHEQSGASKL